MPKKLMDCVARVKASGKSESEAFAICIASTGLHPHKRKKKKKAAIYNKIIAFAQTLVEQGRGEQANAICRVVNAGVFSDPKYKIGDIVGVGVDDDGERIYLEGKIENTTAEIANGIATHMYYVQITEDNDWIKMGKRVWRKESDLASEPTPITA